MLFSHLIELGFLSSYGCRQFSRTMQIYYVFVCLLNSFISFFCYVEVVYLCLHYQLNYLFIFCIITKTKNYHIFQKHKFVESDDCWETFERRVLTIMKKGLGTYIFIRKCNIPHLLCRHEKNPMTKIITKLPLIAIEVA